MISDCFKKPQMSITNVEGLTQMESVIDAIRRAKNIILFMRDEFGEIRFLHTDLGEEEYLIANILMHRNIEVFNFFKANILDIERFREQPHLSNEYGGKILEYIKLGNLKNLNLNI